MTSGIEINTVAILAAARAEQPAPPKTTAAASWTGTAAGPSIAAAASRAEELWANRIAVLERSTAASADLLADCVAAYLEADARSDERLGALAEAVEAG